MSAVNCTRWRLYSLISLDAVTLGHTVQAKFDSLILPILVYVGDLCKVIYALFIHKYETNIRALSGCTWETLI